VVLTALGGLVAGVATLLGADRTDLVLDGYVVYLAALLAIAAARLSARAFPAPRGIVPAAASRRPNRPARPDSLEAVEDVVALAQADNYDLHFRLRPALQELAGEGLAASGIDLVREPAKAEARLSPATWALIRPDRPRPQGAHSRGIDTASLSTIVAELEGMLPS
jgi:NaMN:DMB phosphoribosyltransferase